MINKIDEKEKFKKIYIQPHYNVNQFFKLIKYKFKEQVTLHYAYQFSDIIVKSSKYQMNIDYLVKEFNKEIESYINDTLNIDNQHSSILYYGDDDTDDKIDNVINEVLKSRDQIHSIVDTGYPKLNETFSGGLQKSRVYLLMGKTGFGKSQFTIQLTRNFLERKMNVLFITLENTLEETYERLLSNIQEIPLQNLYSNKVYVKGKVKQFFKMSGQKLDVEYIPSDTLSPQELKNFIYMREQQNLIDKFDIIIVDYIDLMKYPNKSEQERIRIQKLMRELKNVAQETNTCIITPSQVHRSQFKEKRLSLQNISESFGKVQEQDGVLILEQTDEDINNNHTVIHIQKNRHGKSHVRINYDIDFSMMKFKEKDYLLGNDVDELDEDDDVDNYMNMW